MADLNIAYTVQLNIIKLQTKYKINPFHRSQENFNESFFCSVGLLKFQITDKQEAAARQI